MRSTVKAAIVAAILAMAALAEAQAPQEKWMFNWGANVTQPAEGSVAQYNRGDNEFPEGAAACNTSRSSALISPTPIEP